MPDKHTDKRRGFNWNLCSWYSIGIILVLRVRVRVLLDREYAYVVIHTFVDYDEKQQKKVKHQQQQFIFVISALTIVFSVFTMNFFHTEELNSPCSLAVKDWRSKVWRT